MRSITKARTRSHVARIERQARICLRRGNQVVPVPAGQKGPRLHEWQKLQLHEADIEVYFGETDNIGVILGSASHGLVDIDLDTPEAMRAARFFLPETDRIHGRPSKPRSHLFYECEPPPKPAKFMDADGTAIVECRSNGQQTLIPPSFHPSGERYKWEATGQPARVDARVLIRQVSRLAACALVARHWLSKGARHELTLALSGSLLRSNWAQEEVEHFVTAAAFASMTDEEWKVREKNVKSSLTRLATGKPTTGIPKLASFLGDDVVSKFLEWLEISPDVNRGSFSQTPVLWPEQPDSAAFHGLAGEFVSIIEPQSEADPMALLSQFIVGFGNVIGRSAHCLVEADKHFTNLYAVLVGPTSKGRKGSALSHVRRVLCETDSAWADNCIASGLATGEGLIESVRDSIYSKDGEKLVDAGVDDKRLLAVESEFAQQLKLMSREGNILSTVIRQAWDTGSLRTLTKNSPAQASGAHISILGHITGQELRRYLNQTELANGFGNRFLWLCVKRSKLLPEGGKLNDDSLKDFSERLTSVVEWARRVKKMNRSTKARKLWADVYPELSEGSAGLLGSVTSRAEAQVTRLSLIYALLDHSPRIQTQHLKAALAFWEYSKASAEFVFGESLGDPLADEILRALRQNDSGMTRRRRFRTCSEGTSEALILPEPLLFLPRAVWLPVDQSQLVVDQMSGGLC